MASITSLTNASLVHCIDYLAILNHPLFGRVSVNWRATVMEAGALFAAVQIASAFFAGQLYYCLGYAVLGGVALLGAHFSREYIVIDELKKSVSSLESTNKDLQSTNRDLKDTRHKLEGVASTLQRENSNLHNNTESLRHTKDQLVQTNENLSREVAQMKEAGQRIQERLVEFRAENLQLKASVTGLAVTKEELDKGVAKFDGNLYVLEQDIAQSKTLVQDTVAALNKQKEELNQKFQKLDEQMENLKKHDLLVLQKLETHAKLDAENKQVRSDIQNQLLQLAALQATLHSEKEQLEKVRADLDQSNTALAANILKLSATQAKLTASADKIHDLTHPNTGMV